MGGGGGVVSAVALWLGMGLTQMGKTNPDISIITVQFSHMVALGQGKVRECIFFKIREKSGNFNHDQGKFRFLKKSGKTGYGQGKL